MLCDDADIVDLAPLRYVRSITAPLSPLQARRFRDRFGIAVLNCYGQTEIGGEIVGLERGRLAPVGRDQAGLGRPPPRRRGRAGRRRRRASTWPATRPGELWVRTPALSAGYADGADLADRLTPDGWFRTGDVGRVDADGFVWIEGRLSDMINRGGLKVVPDEVAEVIRLSPDGGRRGRGRACPTTAWARCRGPSWSAADRPLDGVDAEALEALCREHLAPYKVPVRFEAVDGAAPQRDRQGAGRRAGRAGRSRRS